MTNNQRFSKKTALGLLFLILNQAFFPSLALALTSGPSQPEAHGFQPINASNMVDLFTGDFSYNIPLLDVDGYPVNLSYQANPSMDDEASWVGLGWSLNPGVVNRDLRGFPDDFKNETIKKEYNIINDNTWGLSAGASVETAGFGPNVSGGFFHNNITGFGKDIKGALQFGPKCFSGNIGFGYNSKSGLDVDASVGLKISMNKGDLKASFSGSTNSRSGLKQLNFGLSNTTIDNKGLNAGDRGGSSFSSRPYTFAQPVFPPTNPMPIENSGFTFHATIGTELVPVHPSILANAYFNTQRLVSNYDNQSAYGYLYHSSAKNSDGPLLDYGKERPITYREDVPNLTLSYGSYDMFSASGQGAGGQFRAYRNDIGTLRDGFHSTTNASGTLGIKVGAGNAGHGGADVNVTSVENTTQSWTGDNNMKENTKFTDADKLYEPVYFKASGEMGVNNNAAFLNNVAGYQAVAVALDKNKGKVTAINRLDAADKITSKMVNGNLTNPNRAKRNQTFSYLTAEEASIASTVQNVQSYPINQLAVGCNSAVTITNIPKKGGIKKNHHLSEINVTQPDGSRYVYGIPTYNLKQRDVSFSVDKSSFNATSSPVSNGLIRYVSDKIRKDSSSLIISTDTSVDNSIRNKRGRDNYFDATEMPAYAHSFLLTSVLSADYVDVKNDGVTEDDLGNAVKINYSSITTKLDQNNNPVYIPYKWRTPYHANRARHQEGNKSDTKDDKASYVYGEKEVWYMHSIETRTMVAQFYLSDREDAYGVLGEDGGRDATQKLKRLDMIKLFSKSELIKNSANPIPIKTIHFKYDYSLCPSVPNNSGVIVTDPSNGVNLNANKGKLTLKSVYFSYADNDRGKYNRYNFSYKNNTAITYDLEKSDRWGMYRDIAQLGANTPSSNEFPYTLQDENYYNNPTTGVAGLWSLNQIELPSGGKINVTYEIDDYADLQDKRAAQMFLINGFASSTTGTISNQLYAGGIFKANTNKYLVVDIPAGLLASSNNALEEAKMRFFENQDQYLYFQSLVELTPGNSDYVSGYLEYNKDDTQILNNKLYIGIKGISTDKC